VKRGSEVADLGRIDDADDVPGRVQRGLPPMQTLTSSAFAVRRAAMVDGASGCLPYRSTPEPLRLLQHHAAGVDRDHAVSFPRPELPVHLLARRADQRA